MSCHLCENRYEKKQCINCGDMWEIDDIDKRRKDWEFAKHQTENSNLVRENLQLQSDLEAAREELVYLGEKLQGEDLIKEDCLRVAKERDKLEAELEGADKAIKEYEKRFIDMRRDMDTYVDRVASVNKKNQQLRSDLEAAREEIKRWKHAYKKAMDIIDPPRSDGGSGKEVSHEPK